MFLPAAAGSALAAAHGRLVGLVIERKRLPHEQRRPAVVLRALQPQALRGVLHPPAIDIETRLPAGVRALLPLASSTAPAPGLRYGKPGDMAQLLDEQDVFAAVSHRLEPATPAQRARIEAALALSAGSDRQP
jgi:hypothetical protein